MNCKDGGGRKGREKGREEREKRRKERKKGGLQKGVKWRNLTMGALSIDFFQKRLEESERASYEVRRDKSTKANSSHRRKAHLIIIDTLPMPSSQLFQPGAEKAFG